MATDDVDVKVTADVRPALGALTDAAIETWFAKWFRGSPAMRDTDAYNHVRAAVDDLKQLAKGAEQ